MQPDRLAPVTVQAGRVGGPLHGAQCVPARLRLAAPRREDERVRVDEAKVAPRLARAVFAQLTRERRQERHRRRARAALHRDELAVHAELRADGDRRDIALVLTHTPLSVAELAQLRGWNERLVRRRLARARAELEADERTCACGCGKTLPRAATARRLYVNATCKDRVFRHRRLERSRA